MGSTDKFSFQDGIDLINARYYSTVTREAFEQIFNPSEGSSPLPMLTERLNVLHETGSILLQVSSTHEKNIDLRRSLLFEGIRRTFLALCSTERSECRGSRSTDRQMVPCLPR